MRRSFWIPLAATGALLVGYVGVNLLSAVLSAAAGRPEAATSAWVLAIVVPGSVVVGALFASALARAAPAPPPRLPTARGLLVAPLGALALGVFGADVAERIEPWLARFPLPIDPAMDVLATSLANASVAGRIALYSTIALWGPLAEEWAFRSVLYRAYGASAGALILTSVLFAAWHVDPVQAVAVLPLALWLGWLRARAGFAAACVAHIANNAVAACTLAVPALAAWPHAELAGAGLAAAALGAVGTRPDRLGR
jgi:membrane protease YdiL (CAAX protease family)